MSDDLITSNELFNAEDLSIAEQRRYEKKRVRKTIETNGGDTLTLLGVTADCSALGLECQIAFYTDIANGETPKVAAQSQLERLSVIKAALDDGSLTFPHHAKTDEVVSNDIINIANAVSTALADNQPTPSET